VFREEIEWPSFSLNSLSISDLVMRERGEEEERRTFPESKSTQSWIAFDIILLTEPSVVTQHSNKKKDDH
jgi:hypothetical protein